MALAFNLALLMFAACGCESTMLAPFDPWTARSEALAYLRQSIVEGDNPVIRAHAIEAVQSAAPRDAAHWIRDVARHPHEGVRFAACVALGELRDQDARDLFLDRLRNDESDSVKAAAIFGLHRVGDARHTEQLREWLRYHTESNVRANTALLLGRLGEPGAVAWLRRAMFDDSMAVRLQVFEAMLLLGDEKAGRELSVHAHGGPGAWQVTALLAVARSDLTNKIPLLRHRLQYGEHPEVQLAAARGLGWCGLADGYDLAIRFLTHQSWSENDRNPADDSANQTMRIRSMAALALGAIGDDRAAPALQRVMESAVDERVGIAAAAGLLEVLGQSLPQLPFADAAN